MPLPGGRLLPSGRIAMSHCLTSASEIGLPSRGCSAPAPALAPKAQREGESSKRAYA